METETVQMTMPKLDGYEYTGAWRLGVRGEWVMAANGQIYQVDEERTAGERFILRKLPWRAEPGEAYTTMGGGGMVFIDGDDRLSLSTSRHALGNYYRPGWFVEHPDKFETLKADLEAAYRKAGME